MGKRLDLQTLLIDVSGIDNVYFQPPPTIKLQYPCIIYNRYYEQINHADDIPYRRRLRYTVIVIDKDPDSEIPDKISQLPLCSYDRFYTADNLNHDVYKLFF
jgi:hypothetical protein